MGSHITGSMGAAEEEGMRMTLEHISRGTTLLTAALCLLANNATTAAEPP